MKIIFKTLNPSINSTEVLLLIINEKIIFLSIIEES
jgi:hypothetical protein